MEVLEKVVKIIKRHGYKVLRVVETEDAYIVDFRNPVVFKRCKDLFGERAEYYTTSSCKIGKKDGTIECNVINPVRKHIEFFIYCDEESYRPHFMPKERVAAIVFSSKKVDKLDEILSSFSTSI